jgi:hypothetical protein
MDGWMDGWICVTIMCMLCVYILGSEAGTGSGQDRQEVGEGG